MQNIDTSALAAAKAKLDAAEAQREEVLLRHIANGVDIRSRNVEIGSEVSLPRERHPRRHHPARQDHHRRRLRHRPQHPYRGQHRGRRHHRQRQPGLQQPPRPPQQHRPLHPCAHQHRHRLRCASGAYVETKNSNFARGNTVSHLTYIGDSDVGKYCNFGCGTVTCNYDGKDKFRTQIGDYCFIGCNTNLVAPVTIGDGAYTAAGSTITKDVPAQALGIARERQTNLEGWAEPKMEAYIIKKQKLEQEQG